MPKPTSDLAIWLDFVRAFAWPITVLVGLMMFRTELQSAFVRLSSVKFRDAEIAFQAPSVDATNTITPVKKADLTALGTSPSLTEGGVRDLLRNSGLMAKTDEIYRAMRIFQTNTQSTWIAFSKEKLFCVLDDEGTRASGRLIQWTLPRTTDLPVRARLSRETVGLIDIGSRANWLYSTRLYAAPDAIEREIKDAIAEGGEPISVDNQSQL